MVPDSFRPPAMALGHMRGYATKKKKKKKKNQPTKSTNEVSASGSDFQDILPSCCPKVLKTSMDFTS